ncbi:MAG: hypothetical protein JTT12_05575 [Candidatus Brockarchaeota archaeon]|nr:hypothetical protein [Candidatus Brockarchaeota archaeon]
MTVLRATTVIAGLLGEVGEAGIDRAVGVIVKKSVPWAKKPITLSNTPYTIINPHPRQAEVRYVAFPKFVRSATGRRWKTLKGKHYKDMLTEEPTTEKARRTYRTESEGLKHLEELRERRKKAAAAT